MRPHAAAVDGIAHHQVVEASVRDEVEAGQQGVGRGQEVVERLLLDRIDAEAAGASIGIKLYAVAVATAGNTLGGMLDYWLGLGAHEAVARGKQTVHLKWLQRLGPKACALSFLPVIGDPLCAVAGWLRMPALPCAGWMALGKLLRYTLMTAALSWVPDSWWQALLQPFSSD